MTDPAVVDAPCHHTFSRDAISEWIEVRNHKTCPLCSNSLRSSIISPMPQLRDAIEKYVLKKTTRRKSHKAKRLPTVNPGPKPVAAIEKRSHKNTRKSHQSHRAAVKPSRIVTPSVGSGAPSGPAPAKPSAEPAMTQGSDIEAQVPTILNDVSHKSHQSPSPTDDEVHPLPINHAQTLQITSSGGGPSKEISCEEGKHDKEEDIGLKMKCGFLCYTAATVMMIFCWVLMATRIE